MADLAEASFLVAALAGGVVSAEADLSVAEVAGFWRQVVVVMGWLF